MRGVWVAKRKNVNIVSSVAPCEEVDGVDSFEHEMDPAMFTELVYNRVARSL